MKKDSLAFNALKNASYSFAGYLWPVVFSIFVTPLIVFALGVKDYGMYVFVNALLGMMGLLDLGISNAIVRFTAEYHSQEQTEKLKRLFYSSNTLFLVLGSVGFIVFILIALSKNTYSTVFIIAGIIFFIGSINSIYNIIPIALQRFDIGAKIGIFQLTLQNILLLVLVSSGFGLVAVFAAQLVSLLLSSIMVRIAARRLLPWATLRLGWHQAEIVKCYKFGLTMLTNNISISVLNYFDRLLIPFFLGPTQLTYYSLPGNISTKIPGITNNLSGILFPLTANLSGTDRQDSIKNAYVRSFRLITILSLAITISIIIFSYKILEIWLSNEFAEQSTHILIILSVTNLLLALMGPLSSFLMGLGKMKLLTITSCTMALINLVFLFLFIPHFGILGAAWAYLISLFPIFYLFYHTEKHYLKIASRRTYYVRIILNNLLVCILFYPFVHFFILPLVTNLPGLIVGGSTSVLLYLFLYWVLGFFEKEDERDIKDFLSLSLIRIGIKKNT